MSVTSATGFLAAATAAGLKSNGQPDLALVLNTGPRFDAAGVFTSNRFPAAPVLWSRQVLADSSLKAVVLNSGGANACTGPEGFADAHRTAELVAEALTAAPALRQAQGTEVGAGEVAVCSTGLIGVRLAMDKLEAGIPAVVGRLDAVSGRAAAEAIMTTDTVPKQATVVDEGWSVGGMAKGAGMLAPGLATMLVVLTTDALVDPAVLPAQLAEACRVSFDRVDSDGCMSTNDAVILLSSGASGITPRPADFAGALAQLCTHLASQLLADAEGAAHEIGITVRGADSEEDAVTAARSIARSNLVKCAVFGRDPNWGRVLAALGTTAVPFEPDRVSVAINDVEVCREGSIGESRDLVDLSGRAVTIDVNLRAGTERATVWTNDLTHDYVKENAEYST